MTLSVKILPIKEAFILLFFLHGILYFLYPEQISDPSSKIKLIKYVLLIMFSLFFLYLVTPVKILNSQILIVFIVCFYLMANTFFFSEKLILFLFPFIFMYVFINNLMNQGMLFRLAIVIYIVAALFAYIEYIFFNGVFTRFGHGSFGYRISSIFINPNNFGITLVFISIFILENFKNKIFKGFIYFNTLLLVLLTISKTAIVIFFVYLIFKFFKRMSIVFIFFALYLLFIGINIDTELWLSSLRHRSDYNDLFLNLVAENWLFPFYISFQYTDNIFFQLWGFFSFFGLFFFTALNLLVAVILIHKKDFLNFIVLVLFMLVGITTNFLYTWPLSYMYWGFILYILSFYVKNKKQSLHKNGALLG